MNFPNEHLQKLDLTGVKPTSVPMETIEVNIDPAVMVDQYATAFVAEIQRVNPRRYEQVPITKEEAIKYCRFILSERIKCIHDQCTSWRLLKNLWIPVFIQYAISLVGSVTITQYGLKLVPVMEECTEMTLEEALELSSRLSYYEDDVQIRIDAMPRSREGDQDTMSSALVAGYVRSIKPVDHPIATYIAAFLGFSLKREQAFSVLYRIQYDDLEFIRAALTSNRTVMGHGAQY